MTTNTLQTIFHAYRFDLDNATERTAWEALKAKLTAEGLEVFETWGGKGSHYQPELDGRILELETAHLFDNQWNTAPIEGHTDKGLRVFDWAKDYPIDFSPNIARGHWLEQTAEMREVRRNTVGCGYCGRQEPAAKGYVFCP